MALFTPKFQYPDLGYARNPQKVVGSRRFGEKKDRIVIARNEATRQPLFQRFCVDAEAVGGDTFVAGDVVVYGAIDDDRVSGEVGHYEDG